MPIQAAFVYDDRMSAHVLSEVHPMKPVRLSYVHSLLESYGAFDSPDSSVEKPRLASKDELAWFHAREYVDGVEAVGEGRPDVDPARFNFGPGDNPA